MLHLTQGWLPWKLIIGAFTRLDKAHVSISYVIIELHVYYTLGKKGCYTPIEDNKTNVDRTFVFPLGWNWHDMDPWLFPNEIWHYLGQTFNARSSGIVGLRNHSIGNRSPKSIFRVFRVSRKTTPRQDRALLRMVRQDRFLSARALTARMRNLYGMRAGRTTINNRLLSRGYRAYRPTTKPLLTANHRRLCLDWAHRWRNLTVAHWQHVVFGDESRFQFYLVDGRLRVRRLPGERFRPGCKAHRVQAGGDSVHVWGAFHNSAKSPLVLPDGYLTGVLYRGILQNTLVPFARHYFGDNYRYQDDNATPHRARVVLDFQQPGNVTKMEQPPRSPNCNPYTIFGKNWAEQSALWTICLRILMSFARPCWINGRRSQYNAFSAL